MKTPKTPIAVLAAALLLGVCGLAAADVPEVPDVSGGLRASAQGTAAGKGLDVGAGGDVGADVHAGKDGARAGISGAWDAMVGFFKGLLGKDVAGNGHGKGSAGLGVDATGGKTPSAGLTGTGAGEAGADASHGDHQAGVLAKVAGSLQRVLHMG